jgi:hypothetical protein
MTIPDLEKQYSRKVLLSIKSHPYFFAYLRNIRGISEDTAVKFVRAIDKPDYAYHARSKVAYEEFMQYYNQNVPQIETQTVQPELQAQSEMSLEDLKNLLGKLVELPLPVEKIKQLIVQSLNK